MIVLAYRLWLKFQGCIQLALIVASLGYATICPSIARAEPLVISSNEPVADLISHMAIVRTARSAEDPQRTGMHITLTSKDPTATAWRLSTEMLKPATFEFYQHTPQGNTVLLSVHYPHQPHETRASQGRQHPSPPIVLAPGQQIELTALFDRPPDANDFPVSLLPEAMHDEQQTHTSYRHGSYMGASVVFLLFFIVFSQLLSSTPARYYAVYYFFLATLALHSYGYTQSIISHRFNELYFPAFRFFQISIMLAYIGFATAFVRASQHYPVLYRIVRIYIVVSIALLLAEAMVFARGYPILVQIMALGFLAISIATVYLALRDRLVGAGLFALGFIVLLINGVVNYIASFPAFFAYNTAVDTATLSLQLIDAFIFAAAIVSQTQGLKRDRDDALQARVIAAEEKLQVSEKLRESEHERDNAKRLAERHRSKLATTSHDLRQPLSSLKLALRDTRALSPDTHGKLASGLEYLNSVLDGALDESMPASSSPAHTIDSTAGQEQHYEDVPLQIIFDNIQRIFSAEAASKGLTLRVASTTLTARTSAVMLIRVLSNLVGNAIKYTSSGTVLIGARRRGSTIALQVWDTGSGLDAATLQRVMKAYQRGDDTDDNIGVGLGLSIVHNLLDEHGLSLDSKSTVQVGSVFTVSGIDRVA